MNRSRSPGSRHMAGLLGLFFLSGWGGLVLQVLWMYRLGLVFGNAAYATAATLSAFFLGLSVGGWFWGRAAPRLSRPLATYGLIELGIAAAALLWLPGLDFYEARYAALTTLVGPYPGGLVLSKFALSISLLLLPTFLMGGTFPMLAQHLVRDLSDLGKRGTLLYAFNTLGAALGAMLAGFYLLPSLGVTRSYFAAVGVLAAVGVAALVFDRFIESPRRYPDHDASIHAGVAIASARPTGGLDGRLILAVAALSGFLTLAAETLWTRSFAQVLQNSVYSFSAILVVFLVSLALGGMLAHALSRTSWSTSKVLAGLCLAGALAVGLSPVVFQWVTDGATYIAPRATWTGYMVAVFVRVAVVLVPPTVVMGAIFPFLLNASADAGQQPGQVVGRLVLFNSMGAVAGPVVAGFVLLDFVGLWYAIKLMAVVYGAMALVVAAPGALSRSRRRVAASAAAVLLVIALPNPPDVRLEPGETLQAVWQASDGVVSVVEREGSIELRLDNYYALGDSRSSLVEQMQAHVPLLIHPHPADVLFLGLGTGMTAGGALVHDVESIVAAELVPNVALAAELYFSPWANGLFDDPRVEIVNDDARNYLLGSSATFDVIVGDLFTPWHSGTGSLYTVEQFSLVREHLSPGGVFAQWLPLYQLTPEVLETIAATFASVFPQVTVWRSDFSDSRASVALVGQESGATLDQEVLRRNSSALSGLPDDSSNVGTDHMAMLFYVGNLSAAPDRFADVALNTDDRRIVELRSPVLSQRANAGRDTFMVGTELDRFFSALRTAVPPGGDPYLIALPDTEVRYADAGHLYFQYLSLARSGRDVEAAEVFERMVATAPAFAELASPDSGTSR